MVNGTGCTRRLDDLDLSLIAWRRTKVAVDAPLEGFFDSLAGAVRYMRYAPGVRIVLLRNLIFGVLIGAIRAGCQ